MADTQAVADPRQGAALVRASKVYADEDVALTWRLFAWTLVVFLLSDALALAPLPLPVRVFGSVVAGLTTVRLFIFFHDWAHGAIFRKSTAGAFFMHLVGLYTLNPPSVWKETHDYHHQNNAKLIGASIGSYPVATVRMYNLMTPAQRWLYAAVRHPLTIAAGYLTIFDRGMCVSAFRRAPRQHWQAPLALVVHFGTLGLIAWGLGWESALLGMAVPSAIAMAAGAYLFYAQHNFPSIKLRDRKEWRYDLAALESSSMMDMNPLMHWFTGNIGYHHVHHLNHQIPFYRLPEAMAGMPELQSPGRTSWKPADVLACLRLKLWDPQQQRMVGWPG